MTNMSRRQALGCAATVGVGVPLLAACGPVGGSSGEPPSKGTELIKTSEVPVGGAVVVGAHQIVVAQPQKGRFKAFSNICTHAHCPITNLQGTTLTCGCHGSQFSATTGKNLRGPNGGPAGSTADLPEVVIKEQGGEILSA